MLVRFIAIFVILLGSESAFSAQLGFQSRDTSVLFIVNLGNQHSNTGVSLCKNESFFIDDCVPGRQFSVSPSKLIKYLSDYRDRSIKTYEKEIRKYHKERDQEVRKLEDLEQLSNRELSGISDNIKKTEQQLQRPDLPVPERARLLKLLESLKRKHKARSDSFRRRIIAVNAKLSKIDAQIKSYHERIEAEENRPVYDKISSMIDLIENRVTRNDQIYAGEQFWALTRHLVGKFIFERNVYNVGGQAVSESVNGGVTYYKSFGKIRRSGRVFFYFGIDQEIYNTLQNRCTRSPQLKLNYEKSGEILWAQMAEKVGEYQVGGWKYYLGYFDQNSFDGMQPPIKFETRVHMSGGRLHCRWFGSGSDPSHLNKYYKVGNF